MYTQILSSSYTADTTKPAVAEFVRFNLTSGVITIRFTETVRASTLHVSSVTLKYLFVYEDHIVNYTITQATTLSNDSTTLSFTLSSTDLFAVQQMDSLYDRRGHCYALRSSLAVEDMSGNDNDPTAQEFPGFIVTSFIFDSVNPRLGMPVYFPCTEYSICSGGYWSGMEVLHVLGPACMGQMQECYLQKYIDF